MNSAPILVYLSAPIEEASEEYRSTYFKIHARKDLEESGLNFVFIDPMRGRDTSSNNKINAKAIVMRDFADIDKADVVLMNFPSGVRTIGTSCEMAYAYMRGKPIVVVCDEKDANHPFILTMATRCFNKIRWAAEWMIEEFEFWPLRSM